MTTKPAEIAELATEHPTGRPRDRILSVARDLFYERGVRAVGVDEIAAAAGTNKMTLYRHFASKDLLVAECLREFAREAEAGWDRLAAAHPGDPRAQLVAWLAKATDHIVADGGRGCALANAAVEITEPDHPARPVIEKYKADMRRRFHQLAREMKSREPEALGDSLMLLWEGAYLTRVTMGQHGPVQGAAKAARALIAAYTD